MISDDIQSSVGMESPYFSSLTGTSQPFYKRLEEKSSDFVSSKTDFVDYCGYTSSGSSASSGGKDILGDFTSWYSKLSGQGFSRLKTDFGSLLSVTESSQNTLLTDELKSRFLCLT